MTRLAGYLRDHGGPLEADLEHYYRRDLLDLWRGTMTLRKLATLARDLPPGAALWRARGDADAWTIEAHLAAHGVDEINALRAELVGGQITPLLRPGEQQAGAGQPPVTRESRAEEQARRFLERQKLRKGGGDDV
jgi:hypothetical protein